MSSNHNNMRRHRQVVKKRAENELYDEKNGQKRSPPVSRLNNPPQVQPTTDPNQPVFPPLGPGPTNTPQGPGAGNNPPTDPNPTPTDPGTRQHPTPNPPHQPTQPTPIVPIVPVNSPPVASSSTSSSISSVLPSSSASSSLSTPSAVSTPPTVVAPTTQAPTTEAVPSNISFSPVTTGGFTGVVATPTPSGSGTPGTSDGLSTGSVVGIVAAGLVAVAAIVVVGMWLTKRYFKKRDEDEFNRNSFIRNSVHIPDDDYRASPRPPTMIERHYGAVSPQPGYGNNGMYAPPVPPMPSMYPGEMMMANQAPPIANPFASGAEYGMHAQQQQPLVRVPSNGSAHSFNGGVPGSSMPPPPAAYPAQGGQYNPYLHQGQNSSMEGQGQGYADLQRSSVTPYQAAHPAFGRQEQQFPMDGRLPTPAPGRTMSPTAQGPQRVMSPAQRVTSPTSVPVGGYSFPIPLPGHGASGQSDRTPASIAHAAAMVALGRDASTHLQPNAGAAHARPASAYEEEDAYGGM